MHEIQRVICLITDYLEANSLFKSNYFQKTPKSTKIFSIDVNSTEGEKTLESILLWKKEVISIFCSNIEKLFLSDSKDYFCLLG